MAPGVLQMEPEQVGSRPGPITMGERSEKTERSKNGQLGKPRSYHNASWRTFKAPWNLTPWGGVSAPFAPTLAGREVS